MGLICKNIDIPIFMEIGTNLSKQFDNIFKKNNLHFSNILILSGNNSGRIFGIPILNHLKEIGKQCGYEIVEDNSTHEAEKLEKKIEINRPDVVIGIGGGKVIDVGKYISTKKLICFISVPTTLSNDGIASPIAVIKYNGKKKSIGVNMPIGVVVDLEMIRQTTPINLIKAGIGDLISNISACNDWELADQKGKEKIDYFSKMLAHTVAENLLKTEIIEVSNIKSLKLLSEGLILSGIAMGIAGTSRPCSGAEHLISHALDEILEQPKQHGIQVGIATLYCNYLRNNEYYQIKKFYEKIGFPTNPLEAGISKELFLKAVEMAPTMRENRYTVLDNTNITEKMKEEAYKVVFQK